MKRVREMEDHNHKSRLLARNQGEDQKVLRIELKMFPAIKVSVSN